MSLCIGLMSGTSFDGIDAALVNVKTNQLIAAKTYPYSEETRKALLDVLADKPHQLADYATLNVLIGRDFAKAALRVLEKAQCTPKETLVIGSHGQTICHHPLGVIPYTVQLGCAHTLAELTQIDVVADFRSRDLVLGGQGAPFAPLYHQILFGALSDSLAVVNIGGISNVTHLIQGESPSGYDLGPGNCLMDRWINQIQQKPYDFNGEWAREGRIIEPLLNSFLSDPWFALPHPKSIGTEYFSNTWLKSHLQGDENPADVQATLLALTVESIARDLSKKSDETLILCGGGAHNGALMESLRRRLPTIRVDSSSAYGIDPDFIEAMLFAYLAEKTITKTPVDLTTITGSSKPTTLGAVYWG